MGVKMRKCSMTNGLSGDIKKISLLRNLLELNGRANAHVQND